MNPFLVWAQAANVPQGWLTQRILSATLSSAEWVLWLLAALSVISIAVILERLVFFSTHRLNDPTHVAQLLAKGDWDAAQKALGQQAGIEAAVVREALGAIERGPSSVEEVIAATLSRERLRYERFLSFLGTLGNNAPFVGLFGTVLGVIRAFHDLGAIAVRGNAVQQTVMTGVSEALVATAVGLAVAIPAVVGFNAFNRRLKTMTANANALGHALVSHLRAEKAVPFVAPVREAR
jgi:biopolymer transport protein ExbB